jgi:hypothetical protein
MRSERECVCRFTHIGELPVRPWPHLSRPQGGSEYPVIAVWPVYILGNEYSRNCGRVHPGLSYHDGLDGKRFGEERFKLRAAQECVWVRERAQTQLVVRERTGASRTSSFCISDLNRGFATIHPFLRNQKERRRLNRTPPIVSVLEPIAFEQLLQYQRAAAAAT